MAFDNDSLRIQPPSSWRTPQYHLETLLSSLWYKNLAVLLDVASWSAHDFLRKQALRSPLLPLTTGAVSSPMGLGSDSLPVGVELGGRRTYLSDSMQFQLELAIRLFNQPAYYIMPSFRGEQVDSRHLNEFNHIEVEIPSSFEDILTLAEQLVRNMARALLDQCKAEILAIAGTVEHVEKLLAMSSAFPRIRYSDALDLLTGMDSCSEELLSGVRRITTYGEQAIISEFGDFVWLTHPPRLLTPFYQAVEAETNDALAADMLAGVGEILGSGQRLDSGSDIRHSLEYHKVDSADYQWYIQMKDISPLRSSGFGLGLERFILWLTKTEDIRDCTLLLRQHGQLHFP